MKRTSQTRIWFRHCPHTLCHDIHWPDWVQYRWRHEDSVAAFLSFRSSRLETLQLLDSTRTMRHLAIVNSDRCSKIVFIVFTFTQEARVVEKHPLYLSESLLLLWCSEKTEFISNIKHVTIWLLHDKWKFHSLEVIIDNVYGDLMPSHKLLGELQFYFCVNMSSQLENT